MNYAIFKKPSFKMIASGFILAVALTGCFGDKKAETAQENNRPAAVVREEQPAQQLPPQTPSFQDGDLYLKALSTNDKKVCNDIVNVELKTRCMADVR